jgi:hypothetical protein
VEEGDPDPALACARFCHDVADQLTDREAP